MNCSRELLEAYFDGELDAGQQAAVQQHLTTCLNCSGAYERLNKQRADVRTAELYYTPPAGLEESIRDGLRRWRPPNPAKPPQEMPWRWLAIAASVLLLASVSWNIVQMRPRPTNTDLADVILTDHIRSLIGTRLVDVPSSDQHTVKPWFAGKLDFSPDVRDLASQGFPLVGGRVEYVNGQRVAALVYHRRLHVINLFIWPGQPSPDTEASLSRNGYNLIHWMTGPMNYWAVSDLNAAELATLRSLYR